MASVRTTWVPTAARAIIMAGNPLSQVATPTHLIDRHAYSALIRAGFRRSHNIAYAPVWPGCNSCVPIRIPVAEFHRGLRAFYEVLRGGW